MYFVAVLTCHESLLTVWIVGYDYVQVKVAKQIYFVIACSFDLILVHGVCLYGIMTSLFHDEKSKHAITQKQSY